MTKRSQDTPRAISRVGQPFTVTTGAEPSAEAFYFAYAGGFIGGSTSTAGTYAVYAAHDESDTFEQFENEEGLAVSLTVDSIKRSLPSSVFNCGWIKLVGPPGTVRVFGKG